MTRTVLTTVLALLITIPAMASEGVITILSAFSVQQTADRMETVLKEKGMTLFDRVKHSEAANKIGIELRETELIIFGNPKVGSPLMQCEQKAAIDLPQKALIWKDAKGKVWVSYNDPRYIEKRHAITGCEEITAKIEKALAGIAKSAATE